MGRDDQLGEGVCRELAVFPSDIPNFGRSSDFCRSRLRRVEVHELSLDPHLFQTQDSAGNEPTTRGKWFYRGYVMQDSRFVGCWRDSFTDESFRGESLFLPSFLRFFQPSLTYPPFHPYNRLRRIVPHEEARRTLRRSSYNLQLLRFVGVSFLAWSTSASSERVLRLLLA